MADDPKAVIGHAPLRVFPLPCPESETKPGARGRKQRGFYPKVNLLFYSKQFVEKQVFPRPKDQIFSFFPAASFLRTAKPAPSRVTAITARVSSTEAQPLLGRTSLST